MSDWYQHFTTSEDPQSLVANCGAEIEQPVREYSEIKELLRPCPKCTEKAPKGTMYVSLIRPGQELRDEEHPVKSSKSKGD